MHNRAMYKVTKGAKANEGRLYEELVAQNHQALFPGFRIVQGPQQQTPYQSPDYPFLTATPDLILAKGRKLFVVEVKTTRNADRFRSLPDDPRTVAQIQLQMHCVGVNDAALVIYLLVEDPMAENPIIKTNISFLAKDCSWTKKDGVMDAYFCYMTKYFGLLFPTNKLTWGLFDAILDICFKKKTPLTPQEDKKCPIYQKRTQETAPKGPSKRLKSSQEEERQRQQKK